MGRAAGRASGRNDAVHSPNTVKPGYHLKVPPVQPVPREQRQALDEGRCGNQGIAFFKRRMTAAQLG